MALSLSWCRRSFPVCRASLFHARFPQNIFRGWNDLLKFSLKLSAYVMLSEMNVPLCFCLSRTLRLAGSATKTRGIFVCFADLFSVCKNFAFRKNLLPRALRLQTFRLHTHGVSHTFLVHLWIPHKVGQFHMNMPWLLKEFSIQSITKNYVRKVGCKKMCALNIYNLYVYTLYLQASDVLRKRTWWCTLYVPMEAERRLAQQKRQQHISV